MKRFSLSLIIFIVFIFTAKTVVSQDATPTPAPTPEPKVPFQIQAPWPADISWEAGGGGSFYGDYWHKNADYYAVDFNAPEDDSDAGTLTLAAADGVIVDADCNNGSYGCRVVIAHPAVEGYCYQSMYAHLQYNSILVENQEFVSQGEPLGRVGASGLSPEIKEVNGQLIEDWPNHLHFSIHRRPSSECYSETPKNERSMAVKPDPLADQTPNDAAEINSTTYPVGYEQLDQEQIHEGEALPERHKAIFNLYQMNGGSFGRFGPALGPVRQFPGGFYQEFGPYRFNEELDWFGQSAVIVEYGERAFFMYKPIWDEYFRDIDQYGVPTINSYLWNQGGSTGFRSDFSNNRSIILSNSGSIKVIEYSEDTWVTSFYDQPNVFNEPTHYRIDENIDFKWPNSYEPGPFVSENGFSAKWEIEVGSWLSAYNLKINTQGNIKVIVEGDTALEVNSPDEVWQGETRQFGIGAEKIEILYWQSGGMPGEITVGVTNYLDIIPKAFASEGPVTSATTAPPQLEFSGFAPALRDSPITGPAECSLDFSNGIEMHATSESDFNTYVACVDLTNPYLRFETIMANDVFNVNPPSDQRETVTSMVNRQPHNLHNPILAFNADYFGAGHGPEGFTVSNGLRIDGPFSNDQDGNEANRVSQSVSRVNWVDLESKLPGDVENSILHLSHFYNTAGGGPTILKNGIVVSNPCELQGFPPEVCFTNTHTAVGVSEDNQTLIVIVAEAKSAMEMGQILQAYGAYSGIKLSGGLTSQLWYKGEEVVSGSPVANAMIVFQEEIPRHDAIILEQSQFPVLQAGEPFSMTMRLGNMGFLPWEKDLDYALQHVDGEQFSIPSPRFLPATVPPGYDLTITLEGIAPSTPGAYQSIWQLVYQDSQGFIEPVSEELGFLVTVVPEGTSLDFTDSLQQFIDQFVAEIEGNVRDYLDQLQQEIEARIRAELLKLIPPELQCLLGMGMIFSNGWIFTSWRRKRRQDE